MTPIQEMWKHLNDHEYFIGNDLHEKYKQLLEKEEVAIKDAIMYALDEDGHTGEWKIDFANRYVQILKSKA